MLLLPTKIAIRRRVVHIASLILIAMPSLHAQEQMATGWPEYGGDLAGQRYSAAKQITRTNVEQLRLAWTFHTPGLEGQKSASNGSASFEATPVLWSNTLYFDSPFDEVFAVDARTGKLKWKFAPGIVREHLFVVTSHATSNSWFWAPARERLRTTHALGRQLHNWPCVISGYRVPDFVSSTFTPGTTMLRSTACGVSNFFKSADCCSIVSGVSGR
jgi:hypothetical protein